MKTKYSFSFLILVYQTPPNSKKLEEVDKINPLKFDINV